jgi:branched-chain amino acid transport system substrate-binding protein
MKSKILLCCLMLVVIFMASCNRNNNNDGAAETTPNDTPRQSENAAQNETPETQNETAPGSSIRIGMLSPLTGGASVFGIAASNGAQLYFEEVNNAGGILGSQIEFILHDDEHTPATSLSAFERLVYQDRVVGVIGPVTSGPANAVAGSAAASEARLPMVSPTATHQDVTLHGDFMFRACFLDAFQAANMARFASNELGAMTAAVLFDQGSAYSEGLATNFRTVFELLGGTIVANEAYMTGDVDFRTQLTSIRAANADVLFLPDYFSTLALIAAQVRELEIDSVMLGADGWEGILGAISDTSVMHGSYFSAHFASDYEDVVVQNFVQSYTARFGNPPNSFAALGFDAAGIMAQAISTAGNTDNEAIIEALKNISFYGVTGPITFDADGNPIKDIMVLKIDESADGGTTASMYHRFLASGE